MEQHNGSHASAADGSLVDISWVAERLGVGVRFVRRLVADRRIAYVKLGGHLRFEPSEVERFIDENRRPAARSSR